MFDKVDQLSVNAIRMLSMAQINKANSGHPGLPLGAAPMAYALWTRVMNHNPGNSQWFNRDRFVLSAGHGSAMLYSLLHLSGYDLSIEDLKNFRQLNSKTPGHPEYRYTDGVDATTGPLGQGLAQAVGMAMAEAHIGAKYNKDDFAIVDHYTYVLCGDGDLMEGVASEASSLAGHLGLGKLIVLYDSNDICLDGQTDTTFTEDVAKRYEAYDWQVLRVEDGNDLDAIYQALEEAKNNTSQPSLIEVKTEIGYGSPQAGSNKVHGSPLGEEATEEAKKFFEWTYEDFEVPEEVRGRFQEEVKDKGQKAEEEWQDLFTKYQEAYPDQGQALQDDIDGKLPEDWADTLPAYTSEDEAQASRKTSQAAIQEIAAKLENFWGGSADLFSSNNTYIEEGGDFSKDNYAGRNIWFGVREFAMAAMVNGINLHGGSRSFGSTFFVFSDYLKPAVRLSALSSIPSIFVFTHDSVAVGEDGPTHEPIEQLAMFRAMPNIDVFRPADGNEVSQAWRRALENTDRPSILVLSRQGLPVLENTNELAEEGVDKGAYVLSPAKDQAQGIIIATGSELSLAVEAQEILEDKGINVAVVSMPSVERFERQDQAYKESVLPKDLRNRMSVEAASKFGWEKYVGLDGLVYGLDRFGASGNGSKVMEDLGFTAEKLAQAYMDHFN